MIISYYSVLNSLFPYLSLFIALPISIIGMIIVFFPHRSRNKASSFCAIFSLVSTIISIILGFIGNETISHITFNLAIMMVVSLALFSLSILLALIGVVVVLFFVKNDDMPIEEDIPNPTPRKEEEVKVENKEKSKPVIHRYYQVNKDNYIQELKGLKQLLDVGAITVEEYDKKKEEIIERVTK